MCRTGFKRFAIESLVDAVRAVMDGWMPPALQTRIAADLREPEANPLTARERDVVRHVALGLRNAPLLAQRGRSIFSRKFYLTRQEVQE